MLTYPAIDPVAVSLGAINVHWYGLMYLVGFVGGWWLGRHRAGRPGSGWTQQQVDDLLFYVALGVILGARVGYLLFYGLSGIAADPLRLFRIWEGGMSFHGGLLGVMLAMVLFGRRHGLTFFRVADFVAPLATIGLLPSFGVRPPQALSACRCPAAVPRISANGSVWQQTASTRSPCMRASSTRPPSKVCFCS
jgi:phosphatidylglycerol:prolipoprotein diacylglycerol transferase